MTDPLLILLASSGSILLAVVAFLTWNQNRGKAHVDIVATQNATIGVMSARLDTQGARLDTQSSKIEEQAEEIKSLRKELKTRDDQLAASQLETKDALRELAASQQETAAALLILDHLPEKVEAQRLEIEQLKNAARILAETNLASAHARERTANNVADAQAQQQQPQPPSEHAPALTGSQAESLTKAGENLIEAGKLPPDDNSQGVPK